MSAFDNSQVRQSSIWAPFSHYGFYNDTQAVERAVIFGLYSNSFRNNDTYLKGISDIEMAALLADYNIKIAELDTDEQKAVADITAKRYVAAIETLVHDEKMATEIKKINADSDEWDAKIAALSSDRAALETLRIKIEAEIKKINSRILELQAYIQLEASNLALVGVEIDEKKFLLATKDLELVAKSIDESRRDIAILQAANDIAKIQLQIVEAGLELVDVDMKVARTGIDIAQTENQIAKAGMAESEFDVAKARTEAEKADLETYGSRLILAGMQVAAVGKEQASVAAASVDEAIFNQTKLDHESSRQAERIQSIANRAEQRLFGIQERDVSAALEKTITEKTNATQAAIDQDKIRSQDSHVTAASRARDAAIAAAEKLAMANVVSELTHKIKKSA